MALRQQLMNSAHVLQQIGTNRRDVNAIVLRFKETSSNDDNFAPETYSHRHLK